MKLDMTPTTPDTGDQKCTICLFSQNKCICDRPDFRAATVELKHGPSLVHSNHKLLTQVKTRHDTELNEAKLLGKKLILKPSD